MSHNHSHSSPRKKTKLSAFSLHPPLEIMTSLKTFQQSDFSEPQPSNFLGRGAYGSVYKLQQKSTCNHYAVKILDVEDDINFLKEINLINQLNYPTLLHLEGITLTNLK